MIRAIPLCLALAAGALPANAQSRGSDQAEFYRTTYQIVSRMNGLCLNVEGGRLEVGARLITWGCQGAHNEQFYAEPITRDSRVGGGMRLIAGGSGGTLCVASSSAQGQQLVLARCRDDTPGQVWRYEARRRRGARPLISGHNRCANIEGERDAPGTRVITWPCVGAINESWIFDRVN
jgi:hypothetical protein